MNIDWTLIIVAVAGGAIAAVPGIMALRGQYKKESADASASNVDTALKLKAWMEEEITELKERCATMEDEIALHEANIESLNKNVGTLTTYSIQLIDQITEAGFVPIITSEQIYEVKRTEVRR